MSELRGSAGTVFERLIDNFRDMSRVRDFIELVLYPHALSMGGQDWIKSRLPQDMGKINQYLAERVVFPAETILGVFKPRHVIRRKAIISIGDVWNQRGIKDERAIIHALIVNCESPSVGDEA
ncbi:MAG: hypothetical protein ABEI06_10465 [Halobacteriaceae archaeon]